MNSGVGGAIYRSIALDIAQRIINDEFPEGTKLSGRSLLASQYNVSPETIRKAISLLKEENVVAVSQGKEITILSIQKSYHFIEHCKSSDSVYSLRQDAESLLKKKREMDRHLEGILKDIINYSDRLRNLTPYNPVEIEVIGKSHVINKKISDIQLWQHTGATIVAIRRGTEIIISPGPSAVIQAFDRIVVVGDSDVLERTMAYINKCK
ncbi:TrkA C-terminal domain-containing protein [Pelosinus sp. sgz500959]|uniref:TrkA C-terminal domain-containing protein n=1 Tax=Pelosinus sp. sgz500959 TaxID=3242472 RepID=UPI0036722D40